MPRKRSNKISMNVRISPDCLAILAARSERLGVSRTDVIEMAVRAWTSPPPDAPCDPSPDSGSPRRPRGGGRS